MAQPRITRDDLEAKFRAAQEGLQGKLEDKKSNLTAAVAVGGVILVLAFYFLGRRSGRKKSTFVELRRF